MSPLLKHVLTIGLIACISAIHAQSASPNKLYRQAQVLEELGYYQRAMDMANAAIDLDGKKNSLPESVRDLVGDCREKLNQADQVLRTLGDHQQVSLFKNQPAALYRGGNYARAEAIAKAQALMEFATERADNKDASAQAMDMACSELFSLFSSDPGCQKCREDYLTYASEYIVIHRERIESQDYTRLVSTTKNEFKSFLAYSHPDWEPNDMEACNGDMWLDYVTFVSRLGKNEKELDQLIARSEQALDKCDNSALDALKEIWRLRLELRLRQRKMPRAGEIALDIYNSDSENPRYQYLFVNTIFESVFALQLPFDSIAGARDHVQWRTPFISNAFEDQLNDSATYHINLGKTFEKCHNWSKSVYHYGKSYMFAGSRLTATAFMDAAVRANRSELAEDIAQTLNEKRAKTETIKVHIYSMLDRPEQADIGKLRNLIDKYTSMASMGDKDLLVINTRYDVLFGQTSRQQTLENIKAFKTRNGDSYHVNLAYAIAYADQKPQKAIQYHRKAAQFNVENEHVLAAAALLGQMKSEQIAIQEGGSAKRDATRRKAVQALEHLKWAQSENVNDTLLTEHLADAYFMLGEPEVAAEYYSRSITYRRLEPETSLSYAACLFGMQQYDACLDSLNAMDVRGDVQLLSGSTFYEYRGLKAITLCTLHAINSPLNKTVNGYQTSNELKDEVSLYCADFDISERAGQKENVWNISKARVDVSVKEAAAHHLLAQLYLNLEGAKKINKNDPIVAIAADWLTYSWLPEEMLFPNPMIEFCSEKDPRYDQTITKVYFR